VGTVLHLKTLSLDIDVLSFDFLDPPSIDSLEDALRQLYVLEAIDQDGKVTTMGHRMSTLPLDPSLARAVIEAERLGCVEEMCIVAAMLSAERIFVPSGPRSNHAPQSGSGGIPQQVLALDKERVGDHILLLRVFEHWERHQFSAKFCTDHGLQLRGMNFAKDVRRQLQGIAAQKLSVQRSAFPDASRPSRAKSPPRSDHRSHSRSRSRERKQEKKQKKDKNKTKSNKSHRDRGHRRSRSRSPASCKTGGELSFAHSHSDHQQPYKSNRELHPSLPSQRTPGQPGDSNKVRQALAIGFANRLARRMMSHNGYKTYNENATLAQLHPGSSNLRADIEGLYPEWVVYHELVTTSRPFLRQVCRVEAEWVEPLIPRLRGVDVKRLGGRKPADVPVEPCKLASVLKSAAGEPPKSETESKSSGANSADAARLRYLERKAAKSAGKK